MNDPSAFVKNAHLLDSVLSNGWSSEFHDHDIIRVELSRDGPTLLLQIQTVPNPKLENPDPAEKEPYLITLRFSKVQKVELAGFDEVNWIDGLNMAKEEGFIKVSISAGRGLTGEFLCTGVELVSVKSVQP